MSQVPPQVSVDADSPVPPFEQVRAQFADHITAGRIPPGTRLAPIRQLAGDLGIAPGTVARAYKELEAVGLVVSRRGGGTRVSANPAVAVSTGPQPDPAGLTRAAAEFVRAARARGYAAEQIQEAIRAAFG